MWKSGKEVVKWGNNNAPFDRVIINHWERELAFHHVRWHQGHLGHLPRAPYVYSTGETARVVNDLGLLWVLHVKWMWTESFWIFGLMSNFWDPGRRSFLGPVFPNDNVGKLNKREKHVVSTRVLLVRCTILQHSIVVLHTIPANLNVFYSYNFSLHVFWWILQLQNSTLCSEDTAQRNTARQDGAANVWTNKLICF